MSTTVLLSVAVPALVAVGYLVLRNRLPQAVADARGIALQTVIVIVVLLAIAGAVAGVLVARGGEVVEDLQEAPTDVPMNETVCKANGGAWDSSDEECDFTGGG